MCNHQTHTMKIHKSEARNTNTDTTKTTKQKRKSKNKKRFKVRKLRKISLNIKKVKALEKRETLMKLETNKVKQGVPERGYGDEQEEGEG